jgi:hypothetical protein
VLYLPIYVDVDLVRDILDGAGVEVPEAIDVETVVEGGRSGGAKVALGPVGVDSRGESSSQRRETFSVKSRSSQLLELAITGLRDSSQLIDLTLEPDTAISRRTLVEVTGDIQVSQISDVPALMRSFAPFLERGGFTDGDDIPPEFVQLLTGTTKSGPLILTMNTDASTLLLRGDTRWLLEGKDVEDVEGELTVLAYVERVLSDDQSVPLDRYVLPGMNRAMRRQFGREQVVELLEQVVDHDASQLLDFSGPGVVARPIAVYP